MDFSAKCTGAVGSEAENDRAEAGGVLAHACLAVGVLLVLGSIAAALMAPFGARWGWWHWSKGFDVLRWSVYGGLSAAALLAVGLAFGGRIRLFALLGIIAGLTVSGIPGNWQHKLNSLPAIHDISTDTRNVPRFKLIPQFRKRAPNSIEYGGARIAAQQAKAYPDIKPLVLAAPPAMAFERALSAAQRMGWMVVDASPDSLRIEATASTFWFGFKDDIVVRISAVRGGSRVDVRSVSRVGSGDGGTNAERIRSYLRKIAHLVS